MKYMNLDQKGSAMAEYIWIDSTGGVRSKSKASRRNLIIVYPHHERKAPVVFLHDRTRSYATPSAHWRPTIRAIAGNDARCYRILP
jgi:hypothetical protein